jgi:uncharacterized phage protein (TIGR02218 family)
LTWTSGANDGAAVEVAAHVKGISVALHLWQKAALPIAIGDSFTVRAGCDKTFPTCKAKFANAANHRGFPHMPGNDEAMAFVRKDAKNDGGSFFRG